MKKKLIGIIIGILIGTLLTTGVIFANPELLFNSVNIDVNGNTVAQKNQNYTLSNGSEVPFSIVYNGTTYLPFRKLGELMNKEISWDEKTETAYCYDKESNPSGIAFYLDEVSDYYKTHIEILLDIVNNRYNILGENNKSITAEYLQTFNDDLYICNTDYNESKEYILNTTNNSDFIECIELLDQIQRIANDSQKLATSLCISYDETKHQELYDLDHNTSVISRQVSSLLTKYQSIY